MKEEMLTPNSQCIATGALLLFDASELIRNCAATNHIASVLYELRHAGYVLIAMNIALLVVPWD